MTRSGCSEGLVLLRGTDEERVDSSDAAAPERVADLESGSALTVHRDILQMDVCTVTWKERQHAFGNTGSELLVLLVGVLLLRLGMALEQRAKRLDVLFAC